MVTGGRVTLVAAFERNFMNGSRGDASRWQSSAAGQRIRRTIGLVQTDIQKSFWRISDRGLSNSRSHGRGSAGWELQRRTACFT